MTNEERDIIANFIGRVGGAPGQQSTWGGGTSVPATTQPALPPIDRDADALIGDLFNRNPEARYRITQLAFVQEHALVEAQNRIKRLEWELQQTQQAASHPAQQQQSGGFFGGLFGGRSQPQQPPPGGPFGSGAAPGYQQAPPPPQYPPGYQPGLFQRQGSGFLGSALTTAAGVAGGVLAADAIRDMFSSRGGSEPGGFLGGGGSSPWGAPTADPGYVDQGSWTAPDPGTAAPPDQGYVDSGSWDQGAGTDPGTWNDPSTDPSGGSWDPGSTDPGSDPGNGGTDDSLI
jgi:hypothetical protein